MYHAESTTPSPGTAALITCAAVGTFYLIAATLPRDAALVIGPLALATVALAGASQLAAIGPRATASAAGLAPVAAIHVVAAVLIGASCWYLGLQLVERIPWGDGALDTSARLTTAVREPSLAVTLVTLALLPALGEELVFRGILARGLATRWPPAAAVAVSALAFAAYHLSPLQALPALLLGLALGTLAVRARSVVPAMIAHALNNTIVIAVSRDDGASGVARWIDGHAPLALAGALLLTGSGVALAVAGRPA